MLLKCYQGVFADRCLASFIISVVIYFSLSSSFHLQQGCITSLSLANIHHHPSHLSSNKHRRLTMASLADTPTTRLRRTFAYPNDSDSDSPEAMDEQGISHPHPQFPLKTPQKATTHKLQQNKTPSSKPLHPKTNPKTNPSTASSSPSRSSQQSPTSARFSTPPPRPLRYSA